MNDFVQYFEFLVVTKEHGKEKNKKICDLIVSSSCRYLYLVVAVFSC